MPWGGWLHKPEPRKKSKARRERQETKVKAAVRAEVAARDGYCRLRGVGIFGPCKGPSTWNHLLRRSATRGMAPEERHRSDRSLMGCREHHRQMDENEVSFEYLTDAGADGPMRFVNAKTGEAYSEAAERA